MTDINELLLRVEKPARYSGGEYNTPDMKKPHKIKFCLAFMDIYEVAMSNLGIQIIYEDLNNDKDIICERCFTPWTDMIDILRSENIPLMSIETKTPLKDFDVLGFSIQYELCYTNILLMLDLAKIPFYAKDRDERYPIIIAGGPCSANPEPYKDFFDAIIIGDGENTCKEVCHAVDANRGNKIKTLYALKKIQGVYVPAIFERGEVVKKSVVKDLDKAVFPKTPLIPNIEIVHDRPVVELYRGCYAGCRFCQACFFYRPIRYREKETVVDICRSFIEKTGCDEIGMSSLSTGDYQPFLDVVKELKPVTEKYKVNLQLPSLRLDSFTKEITENARKSSLTFAPEAGTQRLRDVINKNISDEDIEKTVKIAFETGYRTVKLYFMLGLPTETDEDILGIATIIDKIKSIYYEVKKDRMLTITVSASMFIPKPMTPFQWAEQISIDEMIRKQVLLRAELKKFKGVFFKWHGAETSLLEGVFARGDSKLSAFVERAYNLGCFFDGWAEKFDYKKWQQAMDFDPLIYTAGKSVDEELVWDFIDCGVKKEFLLKEYEKALTFEKSDGCKNVCQNCGANRMANCRKHKGE